MKPQTTQFRCWLALFSLAASLQLCPGHYDPGSQRWITRDPINEYGSQLLRATAKGFHWNEESHIYLYVGNAPNNLVDPFGLGFMDCVRNALHDEGVNISLSVLCMFGACVAGCGAATGGVGIPACLIGCASVTIGGHAVGLVIACLSL